MRNKKTPELAGSGVSNDSAYCVRNLHRQHTPPLPGKYDYQADNNEADDVGECVHSASVQLMKYQRREVWHTRFSFSRGLLCFLAGFPFGHSVGPVGGLNLSDDIGFSPR
jgi:hypothetical protein